MKKFAIRFVETVNHTHELVIECEDMEEARIRAEEIIDEEPESADDLMVIARNIGCMVAEFREDVFVQVDEINDEDVYQESEEA